MCSSTSHSHQPASQVEATSQSNVGSELRFSLQCPNCKTGGWVQWNRLGHGLRCGKCNCQFLLSRNGRTQNIADLPHTRYTCPRCGQSGSIPRMLTIRGAQCTACHLTLVPGEDHKMHDAAEVILRTAVRSADRKPDRPGRLLQLFERVPLEEGPLRKLCFTAMGLVVASILITGVLWLWSLLDNSPSALARGFTYACLTGDKQAPQDYIADDEVERVELTRWRSYYFTSIVDSIRPSGDRVSISVDVVEQSEQRALLHVSLHSRFLGTRDHKQCWELVEGEWRFVPTATLALLSVRD